MSRMPGAIWKPLAADWAAQPRMRAHNIICIHTMVGGLDGTDALFRVNNGPGYDGTESHFGTGGDGRIVEWQDIAFQADANFAGNPEVISVENADHGPEFPVWGGSDVPALTPAQVEANAQILAWASSPAAHADCPPSWICHRDGIPLELIPDAKPGRRGVAPHRLGVPGYMVPGAVQWSTSRGKACPGDRRIAQIPLIIARAQQIRGAAPNPSEEDDMKPILANDGTGKVWIGDFITRRHIADETELKNVQYWLAQTGGNSQVQTIKDIRILGVDVTDVARRADVGWARDQVAGWLGADPAKMDPTSEVLTAARRPKAPVDAVQP